MLPGRVADSRSGWRPGYRSVMACRKQMPEADSVRWSCARGESIRLARRCLGSDVAPTPAGGADCERLGIEVHTAPMRVVQAVPSFIRTASSVFPRSTLHDDHNSTQQPFLAHIR